MENQTNISRKTFNAETREGVIYRENVEGREPFYLNVLREVMFGIWSYVRETKVKATTEQDFIDEFIHLMKQEAKRMFPLMEELHVKVENKGYYYAVYLSRGDTETKVFRGFILRYPLSLRMVKSMGTRSAFNLIRSTNRAAENSGCYIIRVMDNIVIPLNTWKKEDEKNLALFNKLENLVDEAEVSKVTLEFNSYIPTTLLVKMFERKLEALNAKKEIYRIKIEVSTAKLYFVNSQNESSFFVFENNSELYTKLIRLPVWFVNGLELYGENDEKVLLAQLEEIISSEDVSKLARVKSEQAEM